MQPAPQPIYYSPAGLAQGQLGNQAMAMMPPTNATTALILSIIGIVATLFYGIGILFAIPGLILANGALKITNQFPNHPDAGVAKAAHICAWVGIGLFIAGLLLFGMFFVLLYFTFSGY
ncbi:MAG: hypothetical protein HOE76_01835 [Euryarchaeota archaeon]|jgi:hypothetical protein|nr:hypothetical protein [Euryarchaeota archaeon]MBT4981560.1 hypothetical protein [Euryarchaeota archaeon]MBT5184006.1 hypothetical protein [Euryarchaeota archaeon]